ncbi:ribosome maturation factor RimM [Actinotalea sp.]|uniref:ribosome maturation factor RimM n=1 Tax=Actinotalea sp. TaxID=1872145 RepID=UPI0035677E50
MELTVATIGRARGLRGEVALDVRTDTPERRFVPGAVLQARPGSGTLTVLRTQAASGTWFVVFEGHEDRTAAEALRGLELVVVEDASDEEDAWYPHELAGLRVERLDGSVVGEVIGLEHLPAQDALLVREVEGARTLIPFVRAIVPVVDVAGGRVVIDPPLGLLAADGEVDDDTPGDEV